LSNFGKAVVIFADWRQWSPVLVQIGLKFGVPVHFVNGWQAGERNLRTLAGFTDLEGCRVLACSEVGVRGWPGGWESVICVDPATDTELCYWAGFGRRLSIVLTSERSRRRWKFRVFDSIRWLPALAVDDDPGVQATSDDWKTGKRLHLRAGVP
jgi:hypothetical protein